MKNLVVSFIVLVFVSYGWCDTQCNQPRCEQPEVTYIQSSANIVIPCDTEYMKLVGVTTVEKIESSWVGHDVIIHAISNVLIKDSGDIRLEEDFDMGSGDILYVVYTGTAWSEITRSTINR